MAIRREGPGFATLNAALAELDGLEGKAGWFETSRYADGTPVAMVAAIHEFGALTRGGAAAALYQGGEGSGGRSVYIPPRPFMRPTVAAKSTEWLALMGRGAAAVLQGAMTAHDAMEIVAMKAAGDIAKTISEIDSPPLAPSTIRGKGFAKPLIGKTRQLIQGVTGVVEKER